MANTATTIRHLLQEAPPGKFDSLLEDVQKLTPLEAALLDEVKQQHATKTCTAPPPAEASSHPLSESLAQALQTYQTNRFGEDRARFVLQVVDNGKLLARTYAERIDDAQQRSGSWSAEWTIDNATISGMVQCQAYCHEDGNVQMTATREFAPMTLQGKNEDLAQALVQQIQTWENEILAAIQKSGSTNSQLQFHLKKIRGILPITKRKLNWNVVTQQTVRGLQETVGSGGESK